MMDIKKLLALLLTLVMLCSTLVAFAADAGASAEDGIAAADLDSEDDEDDGDGAEMKSIVVEFFNTASFDTEVQESITAAMNEITEPLINVHVTLHFNSPPDIMTKVNVGISAGDQMDLFCFNPVPAANLGTLVAQSQVIDMGPYMEAYAPQTLALLGDFLKATTFDGKLMGVPNYRLLNEGFWLTMNKDVLDELGLTEKAENCDNWTTYEEILQAVVDGTDLAGMGPNDGNGSTLENYAFFVGPEQWSDSYAFDNLGDQYSLIYCDSATDTVYNYYATEQYQQAVTLVHDWYTKGLIYKDSATTEQTRAAQLAGNLSFSITGQGDAGTPISQIAACQHDVLCRELASGIIANSNLIKFGFCMPVTGKEPEAAAKFLELMYTNADVMNLLAWGIEGRDWVLNDNGEACFPEGVDATSVTYHNAEMHFPNTFIAYPWVGNGADFRETSLAAMLATPVSKYVGLAVDTSSIANELTACYNVSQQYRAILNCGQANPETALPEFLAALEEAGVQKILDSYQTQLDAWLAGDR